MGYQPICDDARPVTFILGRKKRNTANKWKMATFAAKNRWKEEEEEGEEEGAETYIINLTTPHTRVGKNTKTRRPNHS